MVNDPLLPGLNVDGETKPLPRSRTSPREPYHVRATATPVAVLEPTFFTVPRSVIVPFPFVVRVSDVRSRGRDGDSVPRVTSKLTLV